MSKVERVIKDKVFRVPKTWAYASEEHLLASAEAVVKQPHRTDFTAHIAKEIIETLKPEKPTPKK